MTAKTIRVVPIASKDAHAFVRRHHYSGKSVQNSQLHLGAFMGLRLVGVAQFGPPMDRSKLIGLVRDTPWNSMLELNRLAMVEDTPRNTESRFLSVCFRLIRRNAPHVQWCVSFADATQCGDGVIYRAAGFVLTGIKKNDQIWSAPSGARKSRTALTDNHSPGEKRRADVVSRTTMTKANHISPSGAASMKHYQQAGFRPLEGFQLRYLYFLDPTARDRLTVPVIPFSEIERRGAGMYRGQARAGSIAADAPAIPAGEGGSTPTPALHNPGEADGGR